jgi:hypothetical protein
LKNITGIVHFFWSKSSSNGCKDFEGNTEACVIEAGFRFANVNIISVRTFPILDASQH